MRRQVICAFFILQLCRAVPLPAAAPPLKTFSRAEGLPSNRILCLFQDREGFIWAGTEKGAARYDGREWQSYLTQEGLAAPAVFSITQDGEGNLWFGTSGGICRFNGAFWDRLGQMEGLSGGGRLTVFRDAEGQIWFGARNGLYLLDLQRNSLTRLQEVSLMGILSLFPDRDGGLWVTASHGVARGGGRHWREFGEKDGLPAVPVSAGCQDGQGNLWFATSRGLVEYNGVSFRVTTPIVAGRSLGEITALTVDMEGRLWIGTPAGPVFFDGYRWQQPPGFEGLPDKRITALLADKSGNLWLGTAAGAACLDLSWEQLADDTFGRTPRDPFLLTSRGVLWFAVENGAESLSGRVIEQWGERDGLFGRVKALYEDSQGEVWFGTDKGAFRFEGSRFQGHSAPEPVQQTVMVNEGYWVTQSSRVLDIRHGLTGDAVNAFLEDDAGRLWMATDEGLSFLSRDRWTVFEEVSRLKTKVLALAGRREVWAGTDKGLMAYDGEKWRDASLDGGPRDTRVSALLLEGEDRLWAGTDSGLWERSRGRWKVHRQEEGLLADQVTSISRDCRGRLWVGTRAGLALFDGVNWSSITQKEGLPSQEVLTVAGDASGLIRVAGGGYLAVYRPDTDPPQTYLKNPPAGPVGSPQCLFEFYGADLVSEPFELRYSWRLDKGEWSPFLREPLVTLSDLGNGSHTFEVRALDRGLNVDPTPAAVTFEVNTALFDIEVKALELNSLFATLHHHYASDFAEGASPVGRMVLHNKYDRPLKVRVSLSLPRYMDFPTDRVVGIAAGEDVELPLRLELNEEILDRKENSVEQMLIGLQYYIQGQLKETKFSRGVTVHGRNAMFWDDPRKVCLYISHLDPTVEKAARETLAATNSLESTYVLDNNLIRAAALYDYIGHLAVRYLPDPEHPYTGLTPERKELDYIRFPRETLALKSGDCDDISVLYAAFLQSVGIDTALVDVLDHVFVLFDTGLKGEEYRLLTPDKGRVYIDEARRVWVPVETTLMGRPFIEAWRKGVTEMAREPKRIIQVKEAWKTYQPAMGGTGPAPVLEPAGEAFLQATRRDMVAMEDDLLGTPLSRLREGLAAEPSNVGLLNQMGILLGKKGYFGQAERFFDEIIRLRPGFAGGYSNLANVYYERGEYDKAVKSYRKALELDRDNCQVHVELALTYAEMGNFELARSHYLTAVKLQPELATGVSP